MYMFMKVHVHYTQICCTSIINKKRWPSLRENTPLWTHVHHGRILYRLWMESTTQIITLLNITSLVRLESILLWAVLWVVLILLQVSNMLYIYVYVYIYIHIYMYMCVHMYTCICICIYLNMYVCTYGCICVYICICIYINMYLYIYEYVYIRI